MSKPRLARSMPLEAGGCRKGFTLIYGARWGANIGMDASQYPSLEEGVGRRHRKGAVVLGFSGQVHFITFEAFQREQLHNKPGLLWCAPDSRDGT